MEHRSDDLKIEAKWTTGQRTPLWDALWHRILADIDHGGHVDEPRNAAVSQPREGRS